MTDFLDVLKSLGGNGIGDTAKNFGWLIGIASYVISLMGLVAMYYYAQRMACDMVLIAQPGIAQSDGKKGAFTKFILKHSSHGVKHRAGSETTDDDFTLFGYMRTHLLQCVLGLAFVGIILTGQLFPVIGAISNAGAIALTKGASIFTNIWTSGGGPGVATTPGTSPAPSGTTPKYTPEEIKQATDSITKYNGRTDLTDSQKAILQASKDVIAGK